MPTPGSERAAVLAEDWARLLRRMKNSTAKIIHISATTRTPPPIPAFAPVFRPMFGIAGSAVIEEGEPVVVERGRECCPLLRPDTGSTVD